MNIRTLRFMEFINFRGSNLEASIIKAGGQEFVIAAIPATKYDSDTARIYSQQNIEIIPGLKIIEKATGTEFKIISAPNGFMRQVAIKDTRRGGTPQHITEDKLRQNFRFVGLG